MNYINEFQILSKLPPPGKNPRSFGSCFWIVYHVGFRGKSWQNKDIQFIYDNFVQMLVCKTCRRNHLRFRSENETTTTLNPFQWINNAHNFVNTMFQRPVFSYEESLTRTVELYEQPWVWINAFFKMTVFLISHYQENLQTPEFINRLAIVLPFSQRTRTAIQNLTKIPWKTNQEFKLSMLQQLHEIHLYFATSLCIPTFNDYLMWISNASFGDV